MYFETESEPLVLLAQMHLERKDYHLDKHRLKYLVVAVEQVQLKDYLLKHEFLRLERQLV
jgi:hypothetical protein